jgi:hypothetical protein
MSALGSDDTASGYCSACFTGRYPVPLGRKQSGREDARAEDEKASILPVVS